ncbi:MAG: hypothetical protein WAQ98_31685, partial [Blastocatellia bacterium]
MENPEITKLKDKIRSQELTIASLLRTLKELEKATLSIHQPSDPSHYEQNCKVCEAIALAKIVFFLDKHIAEEFDIK